MKKLNDLRVTDIRWNLRSVEISWESGKEHLSGESCLYQHSDGSWAVDPNTRKLGAEFGEMILRQVMRQFIDQAFPYNDSSHMPHSEVARVEGILRKEDMYQKIIRKPAASVMKEAPSQIRVWRAE